jgi:hypothetical protein
MILNDLLEICENIDVKRLTSLRKSDYSLRRSDFEQIASFLKKSILNEQVEKARVSAYILTFFNKDRFIRALRKEPWLRHTGNEGHSSWIISDILTFLSRNPKRLDLSNQELKKFQSTVEASILGTIFHSQIQHLKHLSKEAQKYIPNSSEFALIPTIIGFVDLIFLTERSPVGLSTTVNINNFSNEELQEGAAFLCSFLEENGLDNDAGFRPSPDFLESNIFSEMMEAARLVRDLLEFEIDVFRYGYSFKKTKENTYSLSPRDPLFDRSMRAGFARTDQQKVLDMLKFDLGGMFSELLINCPNYEELRNGIRSLLNPTSILKKEIINHLSGKPLLFDRPDFVFHIEKEIGIQISELADYKIRGTLTLETIVRAHHLWMIIIALHHHCLRVPPQTWTWDSKMLLETLAPALTQDEVESILGIILKDDEIEDYLSFLTCDNSEVIDLQYTPFWLLSNGKRIIPSSTIGQSDCVRNTFTLCYRRNIKQFCDTDSRELQSILVDSFSRFTNLTETRRFMGYEVDFVALVGNTLYLIECKDTLLPTNGFEMRTVVDHLETASEQLKKRHDQIRTTLNSSPTWKGIVLNATTEIVSAIVTRGRLFVGYSGFGYPVRSIHELNQILSGKVTFYFRDQTIEFDLDKFYEGKDTFLREFFKDSFPIISMSIDAVVPYHLTRRLIGAKLVQNTHMGTNETHEKSVQKTLKFFKSGHNHS